MNIGIAIPTFGDHIFHLKKLLSIISESTILPKQVSVSISSFDQELILEKYPFDLIITKSKDKKNACENRNIAAKKLSTDIISFIDGDDIPHVKRNEYLLNSFKNGSNAVVHNYYRNSDVNSEWYKTELDSLNYFDNYVNTAPDNWDFAINSEYHQDYACGHISIRKKIFDNIFYNELIGWEIGEDAEYTKRLVKNGIKISYVSNKLTQYVK